MVEFRRVERGWCRYDEHGHLHVLSRDDHTPEHHMYPSGYDSRCGMCWLGAPHSDALHEDRIR